jgi:aspartyl-tRNA(Asn)/glutamyl-tRNA(Gln) amidotransferase subunit B
MRGKEQEEDYRYFPEPDLPPLVLEREWIEALRRDLPELPAERKARFMREYGLGEDEAHRLTLERPDAELFEGVARLSGNARSASHYVLNDLPRERGAAAHGSEPLPAVRADHLAELIRLVDSGRVSSTAARQDLLPAMCRSGRPPGAIAAERGLEQVGGEAELLRYIREVLDAHPEQLAQYRAGKVGLAGFFVGKVMRASGGAADPRKVTELLVREIG